MKSTIHGKLVLSFVAVSSILSSSAYAGSLPWKTKSILSSGDWIKIETEGSGIRKISYSKLKEMGFQNPEKVGVYGKGGAMLPTTFCDDEGSFLQYDDLSQVGCMHYADALFFYAEGCVTYQFSPSAEFKTKGYYEHKDKNIYSDRAYYFLSDAEPPKTIETYPEESGNSVEITDFVGLAFHEMDLEHNIFNTGRLFWGESLRDAAAPYREKINLPGASAGTPAVLDCGIYIDSSERNPQFGILRFGIEGAEGNFSDKAAANSLSAFNPQPNTTISLSLPSSECEVFVSYDGFDENHLCANLDFWSVSYLLDIKNLITPSNPQATFAVMSPTSGAGYFTSGQEGLMAWDITSPASPSALRGIATGTGFQLPDAPSASRQIAMFDPSLDLPGVTAYERIKNQDLHTEAQKGADFAIITLPPFIQEAYRLAGLHEEHYGQKCLVASTDEIYNEFSGGVPDIMAYRNFTRMIYDSPNPVENVLLFGPLRADARGVRSDERLPEYLIAFQTPNVTKRDGAMNDNDFIGIMADCLTETSKLESAEVQVGVGVLPFLSVAEATQYVDKVERYITDSHADAYIGTHLSIGCDGDTHQHENQSIGLQEEITGYSSGMAFTTIFNDHVGNERAHDLIMSAINAGVGLTSYIGHGGCFILTKERGVFDYNHVSGLRNIHTPFMYFSACNITNSDLGKRGISENMVLGTKHGLIGAVTSTRTAWSGPNYDLMKTFYSCLFQGNTEIADPMPITVGEAFARAKSIGASSNELSFILMCDPAIKIPVPLRSVSDPEVNDYAGKGIRLSGQISDREGAIDSDFNGSLTIRILAPAKTEQVAGILTGDTTGPEVTYQDETIAIGGGEVVNGRYFGEIHVPSSIRINEDEEYTIHITAYDPERYVSAASRHSCALKGTDPDLQTDATAPWVSGISFDKDRGMLQVETCDDTALDLSYVFPYQGFHIQIDGKDLNPSQCRDISLMPDATRCIRNIPVGEIADGRHTAGITIRDAAGNRHEEEFIFETGTGIRLSADCRNLDECVKFDISGLIGCGDIIIYDMDGKIRHTEKAETPTVSVSTESLQPGRYRAVFAAEDGGARSNTVTLTVI